VNACARHPVLQVPGKVFSTLVLLMKVATPKNYEYMRLIILTVLLVVSFFIHGIAQESGNYTAWLETEIEDTRLIIQGRFGNNNDERITIYYTLTTERTGGSGHSKTTQSGEHTVEPGDTVDLSKVSVNIAPGDCYSLALNVFANDTLIAKDFVTHCMD
jgi:hypothetical protein